MDGRHEDAVGVTEPFLARARGFSRLNHMGNRSSDWGACGEQVRGTYFSNGMCRVQNATCRGGPSAGGHPA